MPHNKDKTSIPAYLFLTDYQRCPTKHAPISLQVAINCESTPYSLPNKPPSFDSYDEFASWLKAGWLDERYLSNQLKVTYNFLVNVHQQAPSLVEHLSILAENYRFVGNHIIDNFIEVQPEQNIECIPYIFYTSHRGDVNMTTVTLGGIVYLDGCPYPIDNHHQTFPHLVVEETILERDRTQRFYSHQWIAQSQIKVMITYRAFPKSQIKNWPDAPSEIYSLLRTRHDELQYIHHIQCWDGVSGQKFDISDGEVFSIAYEANNRPLDSTCLKSVVKDALGKEYIVSYKKGEMKKEKIERNFKRSTKIKKLKEAKISPPKEKWLMPLEQILGTMILEPPPCGRRKSNTSPLGFNKKPILLHEVTNEPQDGGLQSTIPYERYQSKTPPPFLQGIRKLDATPLDWQQEGKSMPRNVVIIREEM